MLTTTQAAARLGVAPRYMRFLCAAGRVPRVDKTSRGDWRIPAASLSRIQLGRTGPLPGWAAGRGRPSVGARLARGA